MPTAQRVTVPRPHFYHHLQFPAVTYPRWGQEESARVLLLQSVASLRKQPALSWKKPYFIVFFLRRKRRVACA